MEVRFKGLWRRLYDRGTGACSEALACSVAVALAWVMSHVFTGHANPMFAVMTTVVCLAPGLPNHLRQSVGMLMGVGTGMLLGELSLLIPLGGDMAAIAARMGIVTFLSIVVASLWGQGPVVAIQSAISALLVLAMGPVMAGTERLEQVIIGTIIGLAFSQVLLTPSPKATLEASARKFLGNLAQGILLARRAVQENDTDIARNAARQLSAARGQLTALDGGIGQARDNARWSLRGLFSGSSIDEMADRYDRQAAWIYAQALLLGDDLYRAVRDEGDITPHGIDALLQNVAWNLSKPEDAHPLDRVAVGQMVNDLPPDCTHWRAVIQRSADLSMAGRRLFALPSQEIAPERHEPLSK